MTDPTPTSFFDQDDTSPEIPREIDCEECTTGYASLGQACYNAFLDDDTSCSSIPDVCYGPNGRLNTLSDKKECESWIGSSDDSQDDDNPTATFDGGTIPFPTSSDSQATQAPDTNPDPKQTPTGSLQSSAPVGNPQSTSSSSQADADESLSGGRGSSSGGGGGGLSSGAVAGVAVGCLIAGAAIAALIILILVRRHKRRKSQYDAPFRHVPYRGGPSDGEKLAGTDVGAAPAAAAAAAPKSGFAVSAREYDLPQPAEDDAIIGQVSMLRDKIKNHAQAYYHDLPIDPNAVSEAHLLDYAHKTGVAPATIKGRLCDLQTREAAIRSYLSWAVLSRCGLRGDEDASLLPREVALFASAMSEQRSTDPRAVANFSHWKVVSANLLQQQLGKPTVRPESVAEAVSASNSVLGAFVDGYADPTQRVRNLEGLLARAAETAFLLFSQPSVWQIDWDAYGEMARQGKMLVFPALEQVSNDRGEVLPAPRTFYETETL